MIKAIMFDLDGTLLPIDEQQMVQTYFALLAKKMAAHGYDKEKLISSIWAGTKAMMKNDSDKFNDEVFWKTFSDLYGEDKTKDKHLFDEFYVNEFKQVGALAKPNDKAREVVEFCKKNFENVILCTNPVFPRAGVLTRLGFVGLGESDFSYISSYENSIGAKPNPKFYAQILSNLKLQPSEVLYFANNEKDDLTPAKSLGIKTYLVGNYIEMAENSSEQSHNFEEVLELIKRDTFDSYVYDKHKYAYELAQKDEFFKKARAIVIKDNKIVVIKETDKSSGKSKFNLPGGGIEKGESAKYAAVREAAEETGMKVRPVKYLGYNKYETEIDFEDKKFVSKRIENFYICEFVGMIDKRLRKHQWEFDKQKMSSQICEIVPSELLNKNSNLYDMLGRKKCKNILKYIEKGR